jgi:hypothetical protein
MRRLLPDISPIPMTLTYVSKSFNKMILGVFRPRWMLIYDVRP